MQPDLARNAQGAKTDYNDRLRVALVAGWDELKHVPNKLRSYMGATQA